MSARPVVVGTSGHIDHGKTALVRRLTGTDTDRLPEEKARGISIELGFAHATLPSGRPVSFVDVPGHERFVKTMLAGAGGIEAVLFVIAADEGVMPQTREHLDIVHFLGVERGVIALNKCDLVESDLRELVLEDVKDSLAGTTLAGAPLVFCSAVTGEGIDALVAALDDVLADADAQSRVGGSVRLPVDRVFSMPGFGTVVTGTLRSGAVAVGDRLELLPQRRDVRVRKVQTHGRDVERAIAGERTALALHGVDLAEVARGDVVAAPGAIVTSLMIDARLTASPRTTKPIANRARIRYHQGTREILGRVVLLDRDELTPGESAFAQLRLEEPEACLAGDRFVLRSYSPQVVIAGGVVLDPAPGKRRRFREDDVAELAIKERGEPSEVVLDILLRAGLRGERRSQLAAGAGLDPDAARGALEALFADHRARQIGADRVVAESAFDQMRARIVEVLGEFHRASPLRYGIAKEELKARACPGAPGEIAEEALRALRDASLVILLREKVRLASLGEALTTTQSAAAERVESILLRERFAPPALAAIDKEAGFSKEDSRDILDTLVDIGRIVKVTPELAFHRTLIDEAGAEVAAIVAARGELAVADLKEQLGVSRKYAVPLLEHFDRLGLTRRQGDGRVAGPRLAAWRAASTPDARDAEGTDAAKSSEDAKRVD
ncbi:MAG: selenocysteine-specific translation elongation factor [bacterium]